jgi:hypothetical protein
LHETITRRTSQDLPISFPLVVLLDNSLGHARGERLAQRPDRLAHLGYGRFGLGQLGFHLIKPAIKALMVM